MAEYSYPRSALKMYTLDTPVGSLAAAQSFAAKQITAANKLLPLDEFAGTVQAGVGLIKLAAGEITTPLALLDLELPAGYVSFRLLLTGFYLDTGDNLICSFSADGGTTFYCDPIDVDTWDLAIVGYSNLDQNVSRAQLGATQFVQMNNRITSAGPASTVDSDILIAPGNTDQGVRVRLNSTSIANGFTFENTLAAFALATNATIPPVFARVNLIRIAPWGNGDINPPTSGEMLAGGSYTLWGITN